MTIPVLREFERRVSPDSVWKLIFPNGNELVGYPRFWRGRVSMVAGENGAAISSNGYYQEAPIAYRKLNGREVQPSSIHVGDNVRITDRHGYHYAGIITATSDDALQLATGFLNIDQHGFPTEHPRSGIEKYEILE